MTKAYTREFYNILRKYKRQGFLEAELLAIQEANEKGIEIYRERKPRYSKFKKQRESLNFNIWDI